MTPEDYRSGYYNLFEMNEKNEKEIKDLKEENISLESELKDRTNSFQEDLKTQKKDLENKLTPKNFQEQLKTQKKNYDIAVDSLGGVDFSSEQIESIDSEAVLYYEISKLMLSSLKPNTALYWKDIVNTCYKICKRAVMDNSQLGLTEKQKTLMYKWMGRNEKYYR